MTDPQRSTEVADEIVDPAVKEIRDLIVASPDFKDFADGMIAMYQQAHAVVFDLTTVKGNDAARKLRKQLVASRTAVERRRVERNRTDRESIAERIRQRDAGAARLTEIIGGLEDPIDAAIRADEERRERQAEAKRQAEEARLSNQRQRIDDICAVATRAVGATPSEIEDKIALVGRIVIDDSYEEFQAAAATAKADTLARLQELLADAKRLEAERAEAEKNRVELERLRREAAEREVKERAEREARERAARAQREQEERAAEERRAQMQRSLAAAERIQKLLRTAPTLTVPGLQSLLEQLRAVAPDGDTGEFSGQWEHARDLAIEQVEGALTLKQQQAEAQERAAAEAARAREERDARNRQTLAALEADVDHTIADCNEDSITEHIDALSELLFTTEEWGALTTEASAWRDNAQNRLIAALHEAVARRKLSEPDPPPPALEGWFCGLLAPCVAILAQRQPVISGYSISPQLLDDLIAAVTAIELRDGYRVDRFGRLFRPPSLRGE